MELYFKCKGLIFFHTVSDKNSHNLFRKIYIYSIIDYILRLNKLIDIENDSLIKFIQFLRAWGTQIFFSPIENEKKEIYIHLIMDQFNIARKLYDNGTDVDTICKIVNIKPSLFWHLLKKERMNNYFSTLYNKDSNKKVKPQLDNHQEDKISKVNQANDENVKTVRKKRKPDFPKRHIYFCS